MQEQIAIMDLGTNTFHLMVADHKGRILHRERQPVKIGKGGINQGVIRDDAVERAVTCMRTFRQRLDALGVTRFRAIGTSALRSAQNGPDVAQKIFKETGIPVEVISGEQEALYIYYGVRSAVPLGNLPALIIDIGGGSVEFILADDRTVHWKASLDIGAQRMMELYQRHDPITREELDALSVHYTQTLAPLAAAVEQWKPTTLVGSSGTFDTLSEMYCARAGIPYQPDAPESPLTVKAFWEIHADLVTRDRAARMRLPGMIDLRVDMIVVASALVAFLLDRHGFPEIRVSSYSLKEGVLAALRMEK